MEIRSSSASPETSTTARRRGPRPEPRTCSYAASPSSRWHQKAVLAAPPGGNAANGFGQAVAVSAKGDEIAVGAPGASVGGHPNSGAVYLFTRRPGGWSSNTSAASMTSSDPSDGKGIGGAVAVSGSLVVAGNGHSQSVYLFMRQGGQWASETQTAELSRPQPPPGCPSQPVQHLRSRRRGRRANRGSR